MFFGNSLSKADFFHEVPYQVASWYDYAYKGKQVTRLSYTCATRDFPRYSYLTVTNLDNGKSVRCKVTDYLEHPDRHIDLSSKAFRKISTLKLGLIQVKISQEVR